MNRINEPPIEYEKEYFFEFYRQQYGKTYIEDFPNLIAMGKKRLGHISALLPQGPVRLLDIGCAYGPFLKAAADSGFDVCGIDPAEDAVAYIKNTLKLSAYHGFFPLEGDGQPFSPASFSVVTLWYVIEHFTNPPAALEEARRLLKTGGVLAFSTPSFSGVSGRKSPALFLEKSPADHWTIWSPKICRKLLKQHGFGLKKIVISGHHPERFPLAGKWCTSKQSAAYQFFFLISRIFGLGDTFEVYAVKERN
jgi:2-polyprenyl-3-methyl-5-hydroxy-6-metoxy-1,4-benzoquinol methylase